MEPLKHSKIINSRYVLRRKLGRGGFSEVWLADDIRSNGGHNKEVAIKFYHPDPRYSELYNKVLLNEYQILSQIDHPHLVRALDMNLSHRPRYVVLQYIRNGSLSELLRRRSNLGEAEIARFLQQIGSALQVLHKNGNIHGDLKPENILLDERDSFYLCDLGVYDKRDSDVQLLAESPVHQSPEHEDGKELSAASDIFSIGVILYEMCEGFWGEQVIPAHQRIKSGLEMPKINSKRYTNRLQQIIDYCWDTDPKNRVTATDLIEYGNFWVQSGYWPAIGKSRYTVPKTNPQTNPDTPPIPSFPPPPRWRAEEGQVPIVEPPGKTLRGKRIASRKRVRGFAAGGGLIALLSFGGFAFKAQQESVHESLLEQAYEAESSYFYSEAYTKAKEAASSVPPWQSDDTRGKTLEERLYQKAWRLKEEKEAFHSDHQFEPALAKLDTMKLFAPALFKPNDIEHLERVVKADMYKYRANRDLKKGDYGSAESNFKESLKFVDDSKVRTALKELQQH